MAHMMSQQGGQDGRSVLGMLAVQVEKDPKTGATIVRSVAPLSASADAAKATTVFDDGRKSIHTVSGLESQPTNEELNQILSAIDGVGMKVLLEEVKVTPNNSGVKKEETKGSKEKVIPVTTYNFYSEKDFEHSNSSGSTKIEAEAKVEKYTSTVRNAEEKTMTMVKEAIEKKDDMVTPNPVTLLFLGYTDETTDFEEENNSALTVERVLITEDGEEHVLGPQMPPQSSLTQGAEPEGKEESKNKTLIPENENSAEFKKDGKAKPKSCHCCSVM